MTVRIPALRGDRSLRRGDEDKLGFRDIAKRIAVALADHASDDGLVVGLEGAWGSGKSSLLSLIEEELEQLPLEQKPTVISFRPWLVGNRDSLLSNLFTSLKKEIAEVEKSRGERSGIAKEKAKAAAEALRKFTVGLGKAGAFVEFAGDAIDFKPLKSGQLPVRLTPS